MERLKRGERAQIIARGPAFDGGGEQALAVGGEAFGKAHAGDVWRRVGPAFGALEGEMQRGRHR